MNSSFPSRKNRKKTTFIPRLAYGVMGVGLGLAVVPSVACSSSDSPDETTNTTDTNHIDPAIPPDAGADATTSTNHVDPAIPLDAAADATFTDSVLPYIFPDSGTDAGDAAPDDDAADAGDGDAKGT
jgi:hypothetical protein